MSLLLEALKKAEKAKEEAQRKARGDAPAADTKPVLTRAELPDIRQPLEILSDDINPASAPATPAQPQAQAPNAGEIHAADRATAKKVFEAKFKEPNPRLPFYITMGLLGVFAIGTVGYFWYQLRPPAPLVNSNPTRSAQELAAPAVETKTVSPASVAVTSAPVIPGLPTAAGPTPLAAAPTAALPPAPRVQAAPRPVPAPRASASTVSQVRLAPQVHPKVETGYAAYLAGDFAAARADYREALRDDGGNRDALLGLAAIDVRSGRYETAEAAYLRLLQVDPNDAHAQAGLISLRASRLDPLATESRVKSLLAADPGANVLQFTLGNQLAQQARWAEAQQHYFKAFAADPENADFAYNLAVSLDHLRQSRPALEYYRRAIALGEKGSASFDLAAARNRATQLEKAAGLTTPHTMTR
jgi:tetratricopeptide (TPR) repeat protein